MRVALCKKKNCAPIVLAACSVNLFKISQKAEMSQLNVVKMDKDSAALQKKLQNELEQYQSGQKDFSKLVQQRQLLEGQMNENNCVLDELNLLGSDNKVYKLFGPVLVKQELEESKQNVGKRIEYIKKELKRCNDTLETLEKKQDKHRENLQKLQQQYQVAIAMK